MSNDVKEVSIVGLITTAFAFVAALAWNDAIQKSITAAVGDQGSGVGASLLYAALVTVIVIVMIFVIKQIHSSARKWTKKMPWAPKGDDGNDSDVDSTP
jgi:hypothetical protein